MRIIGARLGLIYFLCSFGLLVDSPISGAILKSQDDVFWGTQVWSGATMTVSFLCFCGVKLMVGKGKIFVKV